MESIVTKAFGSFSLFHPTKGQASRGLMVSIIISMILAYTEALAKKAGCPDDAVLMFHDMLLGSTIGFMADIMLGTSRGFCSIARGDTNKACVAAGVQQTRNPFQIALAELGGMSFLKYIVTVLIDFMITMPLFSQAVSAGIDSPMQKKVLKMVIAVVTFFLYANKTRFDFAYVVSDSQMDFSMTILLAAISMAFLSFPESNQPGMNSVFAPRSRFYVVIGAFTAMCAYFGLKGVRTGFLHGLFHGNDARSAVTGGVVLAMILALAIGAMASSSSEKHQERDTGYELTTGLMAAAGMLFVAGFVLRMRKNS